MARREFEGLEAGLLSFIFVGSSRIAWYARKRCRFRANYPRKLEGNPSILNSKNNLQIATNVSLLHQNVTFVDTRSTFHFLFSFLRIN